VELFPAGGDGKRRLPEADSHVDFRDRLPWTAVRMLGRMGVSPEMLEERLYELRGRAASQWPTVVPKKGVVRRT
jgi:hypothetical protein